MSISSKGSVKTKKKVIKSKYKPRIVNFTDVYETITVDTRLGKYGFYPGDMIDIENEPILFMGVASGEKHKGCVVYATQTRECDYVLYDFAQVFDSSLSPRRVYKRYGQKLIDAGKMKQKK